MICGPCKITDHPKCKGGTRCDCQHKPTLAPSTPAAQVLTLEGIETQEAHGDM